MVDFPTGEVLPSRRTMQQQTFRNNANARSYCNVTCTLKRFFWFGSLDLNETKWIASPCQAGFSVKLVQGFWSICNRWNIVWAFREIVQTRYTGEHLSAGRFLWKKSRHNLASYRSWPQSSRVYSAECRVDDVCSVGQCCPSHVRTLCKAVERRYAGRYGDHANLMWRRSATAPCGGSRLLVSGVHLATLCKPLIVEVNCFDLGVNLEGHVCFSVAEQCPFKSNLCLLP